MSQAILTDDSRLDRTFDASALRFFSEQQRREMVDDDLFAGRSVSMLFLMIVAAGTLLMLATVLITL